MNVIAVLLAMGFSFLFLFSSISKVYDIADFYDSVHDYRIFPRRWVPPLAILLVGAELGIAILFAVLSSLFAVYLFSIVLLAGFSVMFIYARKKQYDVRCNCFGSGKKQTRIDFALIRNSILIGLSVLGMMISLNTSALYFHDERLVMGGLFAVGIVFFKAMQRMQNKTMLQHWLRKHFSVEAVDAVLLFLELDEDEINLNRIAHIQKQYPAKQQLVIFKGPLWKANVLRKKIKGDVDFLADEKGEICDRLKVYRFPRYMIYSDANKRTFIQRSLYKKASVTDES